MNTKELLYAEIEIAPEIVVQEVYDFLTYLKHKEKKSKRLDLFPAESALRKDWLSPEEDEAWRAL